VINWTSQTQRQRRRDDRPIRSRPYRQRAAHLGRPLLHGPESDRGFAVRDQPMTIVAYQDLHSAVVHQDRNGAMSATAVAYGVDHGLYRDPVGSSFDRCR
jgi:hypothetical protein